MSLEEFFVDGDVLDGNQPPPGIVLGDRVDEHRGIPVAQPVQQVRDVDQRRIFYCLGVAAGFATASSFLITSVVRSRPGSIHAKPASCALNSACSPFSVATC